MQDVDARFAQQAESAVFRVLHDQLLHYIHGYSPLPRYPRHLIRRRCRADMRVKAAGGGGDEIGGDGRNVAGIGGLLWVLGGDLPSAALTLASVALPLGVFYAVTNVLVAKPGSIESTPPLVPFLVVTGSFGFAIAAMLVPLLSEFDVALGRTRAAE